MTAKSTDFALCSSDLRFNRRPHSREPPNVGKSDSDHASLRFVGHMFFEQLKDSACRIRSVSVEI